MTSSAPARTAAARDGRTGQPLDLSSWPAYLASLDLAAADVTRTGGRMIAGPPRSVADLALRFGMGGVFLDTPHTRLILTNLGIDPGLAPIVARRMRRLNDWRAVWLDLAAPHLRDVERALAAGADAEALRSIGVALALLGLAYGGDGYYVFTPYAEQRSAIVVRERLYAHMRALTGAHVEPLTIVHARGVTSGMLHLPPDRRGPVPVILGLHQLAGDKDDFDVALGRFREAGFATCTIDLPAHGSQFDGPRLRAEDQQVAVAALDHLAGRPEIDRRRIVVLGGSLGALFALRTAAASPRVAAAVAYASPFDVGSGIDLSVPGIQSNFRFVIGAPAGEPLGFWTHDFHLHTTIGRIGCPVLLMHGTRDHICDFTATFEIARRVRSAVTVWPLIGADHEAASPGTPQLADPAIAWLRQTLALSSLSS